MKRQTKDCCHKYWINRNKSKLCNRHITTLINEFNEIPRVDDVNPIHQTSIVKSDKCDLCKLEKTFDRVFWSKFGAFEVPPK